MQPEQTNHNSDIQRLIDDGYTISLENNCIVVYDVPYLNMSGEVVENGILVDAYPESDHTFHFSDIPFKTDGKPLHVANNVSGWNGFSVSARLSLKKNIEGAQIGYVDYYDKVTYYIQVISAHAKSKKNDVTAQKYRPINTSEQLDNPFNYQDTNSSRAGINHVNKKLEGQKIAIIGLGGTGSYILDLISKTSVKEIHIYDGDIFHTHNAFRSPGAANIEILNNTIKKTTYYKEIYSKIKKNIISHEYNVSSSIISNEFSNFNFVFICIDGTEFKKEIILSLKNLEVPFIDCGIGVNEIDGSLNGILRITTITKDKFDHLEKRIPFGSGKKNEYDSNIQIAELNALNASLAVIKWKRMNGFYHNHNNEHHTTYMFNTNTLTNDEPDNS